MSKELYIFPCREKRPLTARGFKDAQPESHWTGEESDQWGATAGEVNGFWVVDVDLAGVETADGIAWESNFVVPTPSGGRHIYYAYDAAGAEIRTGVGILPGIDIRNDGSYVVLYDQIDVAALAPAPAHVIAMLSAATKKARTASVTNVHGEVGEGGRNAYLAKAAGRMQKLNVLTLAALKEVNEEKCSPPLDDAEVEAVFNSISRYTPESSPDDDELPAPRIIWAGEMVKGMFEFLRDKGKTQGESTGIKGLDALLGGKRLGELTVMLAEAKSGKNTLYHYQMVSMLDRGIPVAYASRELSPETEVLPNLLSVKLRKNIYKSEVTEEEVMDAIKDWKLAFTGGYGQFVGNELWDWMDACRAHGVQYYFFDHLHYMLHDSEDFKLVAELGRKFKTYLKTHQLHGDLIVQPKVRPTDKVGDKLVKRKLDINMLRGGASLGQVLDTLITMDRVLDSDGQFTDVSRVEVSVARSKLSKTGVIFLEYQRNDMTFRECPDPENGGRDVSDDVPVADRGDNKLTAWHNKQGRQFGTSKSGEFFDLKRGVKNMMGEIKKANADLDPRPESPPIGAAMLGLTGDRE
jgi:hypothetical protein